MKTVKGSFETGCIEGLKQRPADGEFEFQIPYGDNILKGDEIIVQVDKWVRTGVIELDCGNAISTVVRTKRWLDLSDRCQYPVAVV